MKNDDSSRNQTTRAMYERYINRGSSGSKSNKSSFEQPAIFRSGFSQYYFPHDAIKAGTDCKWDEANCGGVPMDYSVEAKTLYVDGSDAHTLVLGSTGSKKSRLVVMPTVRVLSAARENMVICDPKGEIFQRTAGFLHNKGYNINVINLREPQIGDCWNMLAVPYTLYCSGDIDKACEFVNDMAINLVPIQARDPYWDYSSRDVLFGLVLLLFKICKEIGLGEQAANMKSVLRLREELFCSTESRVIQETTIWSYAKKDDLIRARLNGTVICPEKTLACIISTFDQHMSCFLLQPQVTEMLSVSTFDLSDVGFGANAIFIIMPDEKTTFHKIVAIFIKQMYEMLIDTAFKRTSEGRFPSRINFILDEFSSLPTITDFPQMVAASRSRNIRFLLVVQSKHQLRQRYKEETDTIMSNCTNWMLLTSREIELLREISELCGETGVHHEPLISVFRLQHLDKDEGECLVMCGRRNPYIAKLPDINTYDGMQIEQFAPSIRHIINNTTFLQHGFEYEINEYLTGKRATKDELQVSNTEKSAGKQEASTDLEDLQKELEAKFDELFGLNSADDAEDS